MAAPVPVEGAGVAAGLAAGACSPEVRAASTLNMQMMTHAVHSLALPMLQLLACTVQERKGHAVQQAPLASKYTLHMMPRGGHRLCPTHLLDHHYHEGVFCDLVLCQRGLVLQNLQRERDTVSLK